jgi:predicted AAA+ superfamily ATPase
MNEKYLPRIIDKTVEEFLEGFGAILIEGPKFCGKTWTSQKYAKSIFELADPSDNYRNRSLALTDLNFVLEGDKPRQIDEWQEVPGIWDAIKYIVDKNPETGQYLLAGSSVPPRFNTFHSGAGRIARIRQYPMSLFESNESSAEVSFEQLFEESQDVYGTNPLNLEDIIKLCRRGGWPKSLDLKEKMQYELVSQYVLALKNDDISRYDGVKKSPQKTERLLYSLSRNNETLVSNLTLINDIQDISEPTLRSYLEALEGLFILDNIPAWSPRARSRLRIRNTRKTRFVDPSLPISILNLDEKKLINDLETFGFMFECMCVRDLSIYAHNIGGKLYHYREKADHKNLSEKESDLVIELPGEDYGLFEVKLGAFRAEEAEKSLNDISQKLQNAGVKPPKCKVVITGTGNFAYKTKTGVKVVPIGCLAP